MRNLFDRSKEHSSCGVGFITHKHSTQTHELLELSHQALCKIPHRGGMSAEGIGDGAGVNIDISVDFYRYLTNDSSLEYGNFAVANFFYPEDINQYKKAEQIINDVFKSYQFDIILWRDIEIDKTAVNAASRSVQLPIKQIVFRRPKELASQQEFEDSIGNALLEIEKPAFSQAELRGFYPLSMSSLTQVYKGRLNSWEVIPYFKDLSHPKHCIHTLFFHTRFSTNTAPNAMFAQPFRRMAHNGELNTDRKNRLSEDAIARSHGKHVIFPEGQSDSARLDQTLNRRIIEDKLGIVEAALAMMPPAWENDEDLSIEARTMLEYLSLSEEKNDGPAALIFGDGVRIGARLDRLGLRPLRSVETEDYFAVMSEAGQIDFPPESVIRRGRIEAGGMVVFDHSKGTISQTHDILNSLAKEKDYTALLKEARITLDDLEPQSLDDYCSASELSVSALHVAYSMNQESFKFMLDPMLQNGMEKVTAMGYGLAPNVLAGEEGGMSRYFSQRFAQVTNPPLDSIREADGMTLRVALGAKPNFSPKVGVGGTRQLLINSPVLKPQQLLQIQQQDQLSVESVDTLYTHIESCSENNDAKTEQINQANLLAALNKCCDQVVTLAKENCDIIILSDDKVSENKAAIPSILMVSAANQRLIQEGLRFSSSIIFQTGQAVSTHDIACLLGFGASAVCPSTVYNRATELFSSADEVSQGLKNFQKAVEKALMKTMGKFGLCTAESYIGGEFFEANFIDTKDPILAKVFPNIHSPVGGVSFADIANNAAHWHTRAAQIQEPSDVPLIGLFKERSDGAGHAFGNTAVREYINMTEEAIQLDKNVDTSDFDNIDVEFNDPIIDIPKEDFHKTMGYTARTPEQINHASITPAYRVFCDNLYQERDQRPSTLRDILALPCNFNDAHNTDEFKHLIASLNITGNNNYAVQGLSVEQKAARQYQLTLINNNASHNQSLSDAISTCFEEQATISSNESSISVHTINKDCELNQFLSNVVTIAQPIDISEIQDASDITQQLASGAMSHGALVARAHEAVAHGTNIAGAMSNSGEGGENSKRYNSVKASKIKQFASGRFGVWVGYLADPSLQEIEIKIAQGAKPGEGGQLPSAKVDVEIAAARGGTPGVELVSPPPHHDTYSIEDLGQLIHDAKAARVRVIVKLVSSEGVGTIAVGVAKAGADVINIAGNTGGTGAAQVTSLKNTGRVADIGIAEVHQALAENGLREKVILRCSNAHQTGLDVVKSAILGGDSFEFGTTALMMLKCVMAKNCNVKCPAGLTTNAEMYDGDPRALAQYFINLAHEVREILAKLGYKSLRNIRGKTSLLNLINHPAMVGQLDMSGMLHQATEILIKKPVYLEANFTVDDTLLNTLKTDFFDSKLPHISLDGGSLNNNNKTVGGQFSIDIERLLNYTFDKQKVEEHPAVYQLSNGRRVLRPDSIMVKTSNSAGQSYAAFNNSGVTMEHTGTCNDGVGKGCSGGRIIINDPNSDKQINENVLIGNFALFGATGGELYVNGQAGDRFGVRNSGAVAVVEGVGDFCCEYMTNGSIINLGSYGKGFGNGMSGGNAYQYDPQHQLIERCSQDSVMAFKLSDGSELAVSQEQALLHHLQQHIENCNSPLAKSLLDDWQNVRHDFYFVVPRALFNYQTSESIAANLSRKSIIEELSRSICSDQLSALTKAFEKYGNSGVNLFDGQIPSYGESDTPLIFEYIVTSGLFRRAFEAAQKTGSNDIDTISRRMIISQDPRLADVVIKDIREALANYQDDALACLLADKRLNDYKRSLSMREVWDIQAFGTTAWIILRDQINQQELTRYPSMTSQLATHYASVIANAMAENAA